MNVLKFLCYLCNKLVMFVSATLPNQYLLNNDVDRILGIMVLHIIDDGRYL